ncbi:MAG: hypothetical protein RL589_58 [Actinomycetota bacterium]|jgi:predicted amidohydrolase
MKFSLMQLDVSDHENGQTRSNYVLDVMKNLEVDHFVILPELWVSGAFCEKSYSTDSILENSIAIAEIQKSQNLPFNVIGSFLVQSEIGNIYNRMINIGHNRGTSIYDKMHTFGLDSIEAKLVKSGTEISTMSLDDHILGMAICYDLRFPELFRKMVRNGMEVLIITASWPLSRISHWRSLLVARAIENQIFVIAVNAVGLQGQTKLGGHSMIVSPTGEILHELGEDPSISNFEINLELVASVRDSFPVLKDIKILSI